MIANFLDRNEVGGYVAAMRGQLKDGRLDDKAKGAAGGIGHGTADTGAAKVATPPWVIERPGADFMVDVIKALNFDYVAANPGTSFGGIHESLINHGGNKMPEFLTACHEESAVAMAHGYAKIESKPMLTLLHGTVGIQHASMAIYNAYADRTPVVMIADHDIDLVVKALRTGSGNRRYPAEAIERIRFVKQAQANGLTLDRGCVP